MWRGSYSKCVIDSEGEVRDRACCRGGRGVALLVVCVSLHGQVCTPRGSILRMSEVWCVGTASEYKRRMVEAAAQFAVFPCHRLTYCALFATCTGCWDKNSPRPKQHQRLWWRVIETGGREKMGRGLGVETQMLEH